MTQVSALTPHPLIPHGQQKPAEPSLWGGDGFGADDFLDLINPLQHLPVISTLYRAATGDTASAGVRMIGGAALGGLPGLAMSAAGVGLEAMTGEDPGQTVLSALEGLAEPEKAKPSAFAPPAAAPLEADAGEALLAIALAGEEQSKPAKPAVQPDPAFFSLEALPVAPQGFADITLGLADTRKREQLLAGLSETTTQMKQ